MLSHLRRLERLQSIVRNCYRHNVFRHCQTSVFCLFRSSQSHLPSLIFRAIPSLQLVFGLPPCLRPWGINFN